MIGVTTRRLLSFLLLLWTVGASATAPLAQEVGAQRSAAQTESAEPALYFFKVAHDHRIGKGVGELRITEKGIEYQGESAEEARHSQVWRDDDIKRLEISKTGLHLIAYEAARIPLIPRKVPYSRGGKEARIGSEREHVFRLLEGEIAPEAVSTLLARFKRPVKTSVIPNDTEESGRLMFEIPVFHRHRRGGASGTLRVYEERVVFAAEVEDQSRYWRYLDIRDIGRLGRYQFEIATYERQFAAEGKSYIFDLKRPMTEAEYDKLWARVYESGQSPRLRRAAPGREKEQ